MKDTDSPRDTGLSSFSECARGYNDRQESEASYNESMHNNCQSGGHCQNEMKGTDAGHHSAIDEDLMPRDVLSKDTSCFGTYEQAHR